MILESLEIRERKPALNENAFLVMFSRTELSFFSFSLILFHFVTYVGSVVLGMIMWFKKHDTWPVLFCC